MQTNYNSKTINFQDHYEKEVVADFNGGNITSDAGGLLLREISNHMGIIKSFSQCFTDFRNPERLEHRLEELIAQRVYGLGLGYEDLNDHEDLRKDPLLATLVGKHDPTGSDRKRASDRDKGNILAGKSTLNRLELTPVATDAISRYKKIIFNPAKADNFLVNMFLNSFKYKKAPRWIVLDVDATDDPVHGNQEGRFFHGYYGHYCYLPLYIFCDDHILCARLREANIDASKGTVEELSRMIPQIRRRWPGVNIIIRGDSGFCREKLMSWCESQERVYYLLGLAKNNRLLSKLDKQMRKAKRRYGLTQQASRFFKVFRYKTIDSWSRERVVVGKAEHLSKGPNPRFIVTNLPKTYATGRELYEDHYCARGDMENRIKEQQLWLFADRTSTELMRANQLRLYFSSVAYVLISELRRIGLRGTKLAKSQVVTIRNMLFKIGALVKVSVRRIYLAFSSGYPHAELFKRILMNIQEGNHPSG